MNNYMSFLNNSIVFGIKENVISRKAITKEQAKKYMSFLNNINIPSNINKEEKYSSGTGLSLLSVKNEYLNIAKKEYEEIYSKDNGLSYILAFKKFDPLNIESIIKWGDEELKNSSLITEEMSKVMNKYNLLSPSATLKESLDIAYGNIGMIKKIFGNNNIDHIKIKVSSLKTQLLPILDECLIIEKKVNQNTAKMLFNSSVLTIVNQVNRENNDLEHLLLRTLNNRANTLSESLSTTYLLVPQIVAMKENIVSTIGQIDDALMNTFRLIEFNKANNGNV